MIAAGSAARIVLVFATRGLPYDVHSFQMVRAALDSHPLHLYSIVNPGQTFHWPYPPGFLPFVLAADRLDSLIGGGFTHLVRIPAVLADAALACLVWTGLPRRVDERTRLAAAALVAFGPVFVTITGYAAQIDSVAILPAVAALLVWEREGLENRAWIAGVLIGVAATIKTVPLLMVLALAPSARSPRELLTLTGCALAVLAASLIPFLIADPSGVGGLRRYAGSPGMGGLSLVLQPDLAQAWLTHLVPFSAVTSWLFLKHAWVPNFFALALFAGFAARVRPAPREAAALLWLLVLAFGSGFFFQYLVWLLPFLLLSGQLRATAALQGAITIPMLIFYVTAWRSDALVYVYVAIMLLVWAGWVLAGFSIALRATAARRPAPAGIA
jgi:hypothetical protein